jgi:hypothetical protein
VQGLQAVFILIISGLGAWIAYKQVRIASARLNLDLYDKRFKVFEAARALVVEVLREGTIDTDDILLFNVGVADAVFLFELEVVNYLTHLRKRAAALHTKNAQLQALGENDKRRDALIDDVYRSQEKFATEHKRLEAAFKPYLNLGNL